MISLLQQQPLVLYSLTGLLGLMVGSFLNVVIYRQPRRLQHNWQQQCRELLEQPNPDTTAAPSIIWPRSHCPKCKAPIAASRNIPVISYLLLKGKCADCSAVIGLRYPAIEILTALLSLVVVWRFGVSTQTVAALLLTWLLIAASFIDIDHQLLPDNMTLPGLWFGLALALVPVFADLRSAVIGAIAGYLFLWLVFWLFKAITAKEGMGYGDFKLLALFGGWLGWQSLPLIVLLAAGSGAIIGIGLMLIQGRDKNIPIPFGPYLAVGGFIALLWGPQITTNYLRYSGLN